MAIQQAKKEIPWCTIFLVTGAIVSHSLVLSGNLATAKAMSTLGKSTGGWSSIGTEVSGSLTSELDKIMTNVTGVLTKAIKSLVSVQTAIDTVLGLAGSVTDASTSAFEKGMSKNATGKGAGFVQTQASVDMYKMHEALKNHSYAGPWAPKMGDLTVEGGLASPKGSLIEQEVNFMGQLGQPVMAALDPIEVLTDLEDFEEDELLKSLPVWNTRTVESLTGNVMTGALQFWRTARDHAARLSPEQVPANASSFPTPQEFKIALTATIHELVKQLTSGASKVLNKLFAVIEPALIQIGKWVTTFGTKVTDKIEQFMTSLDNVQKIFDQIMAKLSSSSGEGKDQMIHESYNLFDASHTGYISAQDLKDVGKFYGVNGLMGGKADELFKTYDEDNSGKMLKPEFNLFVEDTSVPNIMSTVLRVYAKKLSEIAGNVKAARYRDEVAGTVMEYLSLTCAKNMTKVGWVSDTLTNRSLPHEFSADVIVSFALNLDNPDKVTTADVGAIIVKEMARLNAKYVGQLLALTMDPGYWAKEGFDPVDQAKCVHRFTLWVSNTPYASEALAAQQASLDAGNILAKNPTPPAPAPASQLQVEVDSEGVKAESAGEAEAETVVQLTSEQISAMPARLHQEVLNRQKIYQRSKLIAKRLEMMEKQETPTVKALKSSLGAISLLADPASEAAVNKGVPARPETLRFAQFLSNNASATADAIVQLCFDYTSESSSPLDSFSVQIKNMIKKVQNFISLMQNYAGEEGVKRLQNEIHNFANNSATDIVNIIEPAIEAAVDKILTKYNGTGMSPASIIEDVLRNWTNMTLPSSVKAKLSSFSGFSAAATPEQAEYHLAVLQEEATKRMLSQGGSDAPGEVSANELIQQLNLGPIWSTLQYTLSILSSALPQVVADLKFARKEVSSVSSTLNSIFTTFSAKGPPIFDLVAKLYKMVWTAYFVLFFLLTLGVLFYGLWASGFLGGPQAAANVSGEEWYERPSGFRDRCAICCHCCDGCLRGCADSHLCFWGFIILFQIIVLILFVVSIVLCLLAGIKAFIVAGCAEVYLLGDPKICTGTLATVKGFLLTFLQTTGIPLANTCDEKTLLTCQLIGEKLKTSSMFTVLGSLIAAVFSFQMIVESAILHERARWRRIFDEESKRN